MNTTNKGLCRGRNCFFFPLLLVGFFGISAVVMILWNLVLPSVSSLSPLTYWQAMGIFALSRILFGGIRFHRHGQRHAQQFHTVFKDKFMEMNDDEKQNFKDQWKKRCCKTPNSKIE